MKNKNLKENDNKESILSGYVRYRPKNQTFYLMINSKRLADHFISLNKQINVDVKRKDKFFVINKNNEGNILKPKNRELVTCISGNKLLSKEEKSFLQLDSNKFSFSTKIKINPNNFGLNKFQLYPDHDAARLANELEKLVFKIPSRIMTSHAFEHDLVTNYKNKKIIIEISQIRPSKKRSNYLNFKHQSLGGCIRARIFDIYLNCANNKLKNQNNIFGFVILNKKWKEYKHIKDILPECVLVNCFVLFTDFSNLVWPKKIAGDIIKIIENGINKTNR